MKSKSKPIAKPTPPPDEPVEEIVRQDNPPEPVVATVVDDAGKTFTYTTAEPLPTLRLPEQPVLSEFEEDAAILDGRLKRLIELTGSTNPIPRPVHQRYDLSQAQAVVAAAHLALINAYPLLMQVWLDSGNINALYAAKEVHTAALDLAARL